MDKVIEIIEQHELYDLPPTNLPEEDGEPLETTWHRNQINLLIDVVRHRWRERQDFFAGGNLFVYYYANQANEKKYKGPDFFLAKDVDGRISRPKWVVWEENGHYPDVIVELMSPSTKNEDLYHKKVLYERTFRTPDYFCYDPETEQLLGWSQSKNGYESLLPDEMGWLWSSQMDAWLGKWEGVYQGEPGIWLRLFDEDGQLIPTAAEYANQQAEAEKHRANIERRRAEAARQQAETARQQAEAARQQAETARQDAESARQRAEAAEAELAKLRLLLQKQG